MAGKNSKQTKKFVKTKLKGVLERRKEFKKKQSRYGKGKGSGGGSGGKKSPSDPRNDKRSLKDGQTEGDEDVDFSSQFDRNGALASLSEKEKAYLEESEDEGGNGEEEKESDEEENNEEEDDDDENDDLLGDDEDKGGDQEEDETESRTNKSLREEVEQHKRELEELKKKDPEFYAFLAKSDKQLLKFGEDDEFDDLDLEDTGDDEEEATDKGKEGEEDVADDDDEDDDDGLERTTDGKRVLTAKLLDTWEALAVNETHHRAIWRLVMAFRTACHVSDENDKFRSRDKFRITSSQIFNRIMLFSLKNIPTLFNKVLKFTPTKSDSSDSKPRLPSSSKNWTQVKKAASSVLQNLSHFLRQLTNPEMISFILKQTQYLIPYFAVFPDFAKRFFSILLRFWTNENTETRSLAYANIRSLALHLPYPFLDRCLKGLYLTYVRNAKFLNAITLPLIEFMSDCVVDLYGIDFMSSYQHTFVYIRQLAIHLRNTISVKVKDAYKSVYNWQFVNSLRVFSKLLVQYAGQSDLQHLVYPFIQITLGTLRLIPTARYYPLRFLCIRFLNNVAKANNVFVPVAPYLLDVLDCSDLQGRPRQAPTSVKPIQFDSVLKISKAAVGTRVFQDGVISQLLELLLQHFTANAYSIAFPELIVPALVHLKRFLRKCSIPPIRKQILQLIEKLNANATFVLGLRQKIDCSPKDIKEIDTFITAEKSKAKSPLESYFDQFKMNLTVTRKEQRDEFFNRKIVGKGARDDDEDGDDDDDEDGDDNDEDGDDNEEAEEEEEEEEQVQESRNNKKDNNKKRKSTETNKKEGKGERHQQKNKKEDNNKKNKKARKSSSYEDNDDEVKDFVFSDDE